jgi:biopolymer transport protein ExbB
MHMRTLLWPVLALCIASCGRIDYDPSAGTDGGGPADAGPAPDVITPADASPDAFNGDPDALWWDRAWSHRIRLTIQTADQAEDLFDVPLVVYLDETRIDPAKVQLSGADLRFVAADNKTVLAHEIETRPTLDVNEGVVGTGVVIWVKVPELKVEAGKSHIWLYYGNAAAEDAQLPDKVWSSGYAGVWHLNQLQDPRDDVTGNGNALAGFGPVDSVAGQLGDGLALSSNIDALPLARPVLEVGANDVNGLTIEAWINPASSGATSVITAKSDGDVARSFELCRLPDETIELLLSFDCSNTVKVHSLELVDIGRWHHVAATYDGGTMRIYHNGVLTAEEPVTLPAFDPPCDSDAAFSLGALDGGKLPFDGLVDELRISSRAHSAEWIRIQNRAAFDDLISYDPQEPQF